MNVLISGQAGVAVYFASDTAARIDIADVTTDIPLQPQHAEVPFIGATDVMTLDLKTRDDVVARLRLEWTFDRAFRLAHIMVDGRESDEVKCAAADALRDLLADREVVKSLNAEVEADRRLVAPELVAALRSVGVGLRLDPERVARGQPLRIAAYSTPGFPVIIGVTGHRDIAPGSENIVRRSVRVLMSDWLAWFDASLHILTALADGADQLVAEEAHALGIPIIAASPMPLAAYRQTIKNRTAFDDLWDVAVVKLVLPEVVDPFLAGPCSLGYHERQYEQLGVLLARRSHLLIALWDGGDDPTDICGTGAVTRMRLTGDHGAAAFRGSPMFAGANSLLDMAWRGPLLRIAVQRDTPSAAADGEIPGTCILQGLPESPRRREPFLRVMPDRVIATMRDWGITDFDYIRRLNGQIAGFQKPDRKIFDSQVGYLNVGAVPRSAARDTDKLVRLQAAADTAAQAYQVKLMGNFVPALSPGDMWANAGKARRRSGRLPRIGAAFIFAASVPLAVFLYELFVHNHEHAAALWALWLYFAIFAGAAAYYEFHVAHWQWQNRFQDYRALAEAMRVQLYWALSGVPAGVSDHYLRKQSGELGWIQFVMRGPALWAASLAAAIATPDIKAVREGWIDNQYSYFREKASLHQRVTENCGFWTKSFVYAAFAVTLLLLLAEQAHSLFQGGSHMALVDLLHEHNGFLIIPAAALPALAAFFSFSRDIRAYEPHAHSYALMFQIFRRAKAQAEQPRRSDSEFQALVRELGREALAENAEWLADHRHRKIEHHP